MRPFLVAFALSTLLSAAREASGFQGPGPAQVTSQTFEFRPRAGLILLPVSVDGKLYDFALDTGFQRTVFDLSLRAKLGKSLGFVLFNDSVMAEEFKWPAARLGDMDLVSEERVECLDLSELRSKTGQEFYGVLGMDWLQHRAFEIDFDKGRVSFLGSNSLPPSLLSRGTPIQFVESQARIDAEVAGLGSVEFLIDTGYVGQFHLNPKDFARLKPEKGKKNARLGETWQLGRGSKSTEVGAVEFLKLGDFSYEWPIFYKNPYDGDRLLGLEIWSRHVVIFDFPNRVLYLRKGERFGETWVYNRSGLGIIKRNGDMTIEDIAADSPSSTLGIKPGDVLVSVEGKAAVGYGIWEIYRLFSAVGKTYKLKLRRNQNEFEVVLPIVKW
jgi:hypothetical protein